MVCSYLNMLFYTSALHDIGFAFAFIWQVKISTVLTCSQELNNFKVWVVKVGRGNLLLKWVHFLLGLFL